MSVLLVVLIALLLVAVIVVVSGPLRSTRPERPRSGTGAGNARESADGRERELLGAELSAAREAKYQEIRDAELDYRTGKLSREDFEAVDATLRVEAIAILDRIAELEGDR